jgi:hypothetical protein
MSSKVIFDAVKVAQSIKKCAKLAERAVADQIIADSRQYVPDDGEHALRDSARIEEIGGGTQVTYNTPYAAYQYYGCYPDGSHTVKNHTTAGTRTLWLEHSKTINNEKWLKVAKNAMKELD